jgi:hypothetical protein
MKQARPRLVNRLLTRKRRSGGHHVIAFASQRIGDGARIGELLENRPMISRGSGATGRGTHHSPLIEPLSGSADLSRLVDFEGPVINATSPGRSYSAQAALLFEPFACSRVLPLKRRDPPSPLPQKAPLPPRRGFRFLTRFRHPRTISRFQTCLLTIRLWSSCPSNSRRDRKARRTAARRVLF